jgi:hypothetical protein
VSGLVGGKGEVISKRHRSTLGDRLCCFVRSPDERAGRYGSLQGDICRASPVDWAGKLDRNQALFSMALESQKTLEKPKANMDHILCLKCLVRLNINPTNTTSTKNSLTQLRNTLSLDMDLNFGICCARIRAFASVRDGGDAFAIARKHFGKPFKTMLPLLQLSMPSHAAATTSTSHS